jgi:hypothetical protein
MDALVSQHLQFIFIIKCRVADNHCVMCPHLIDCKYQLFASPHLIDCGVASKSAEHAGLTDR